MGRLQDSRLVSRRLALLSRGLYAGHDHVGARALPERPEDLDNCRLLMLDADLAQRELTLRDGAETRTLALDGHIRVNSVAMLRELTIAGAGVALLPDALLAREIVDARVVRILPQWQASPIEAHLLYRDRALLPQRVRLMIEHLIAWFDGRDRTGGL